MIKRLKDENIQLEKYKIETESSGKSSRSSSHITQAIHSMDLNDLDPSNPNNSLVFI